MRDRRWPTFQPVLEQDKLRDGPHLSRCWRGWCEGGLPVNAGHDRKQPGGWPRAGGRLSRSTGGLGCHALPWQRLHQLHVPLHQRPLQACTPFVYCPASDAAFGASVYASPHEYCFERRQHMLQQCAIDAAMCMELPPFGGLRSTQHIYGLGELLECWEWSPLIVIYRMSYTDLAREIVANWKLVHHRALQVPAGAL